MMKYTQHTETLADLMAMIQAQGLDQDEYFDIAYTWQYHDPAEIKLWGDAQDRVLWVAVYLVEGNSEGYYVHVSQIRQLDGQSANAEIALLIGKFYSPQAAMRATQAITGFVNGWVLKEDI